MCKFKIKKNTSKNKSVYFERFLGGFIYLLDALTVIC